MSDANNGLCEKLNLDADTDALTVERAARGDDDAFEELVRKYEYFVYNVAFQILKNAEDASDIAQESFLKAYKSIKTFRGDCKFSSWLYRIVSNTSKDYLRSKKTSSSSSLYETDEDGEEREISIPDTDIGGDPERSLQRDEEIAMVRRAIMSLPEKHREIVVLRDIEGISYDDIAEMLGLEKGTVKSRLNRARQALKEYIIKGNFL